MWRLVALPFLLSVAHAQIPVSFNMCWLRLDCHAISLFKRASHELSRRIGL
jgi:hypothetical protein